VNRVLSVPARKRADRRRRSIFSIEEAMWWEELEDRFSMLPVLEMLQRVERIDAFVHFTAATRGEFGYLMDKLADRADYRLIYLAFHGDTQALQIGRQADAEDLQLGKLAELLGRRPGAVIYLAGCTTVPPKPNKLTRSFLSQTQAAAPCGYCERIDWVPSAAFDLMALDNFAYYISAKRAQDNLREVAGPLGRNLGFRCHLPGD
jgi:hypothetical protein